MKKTQKSKKAPQKSQPRKQEGTPAAGPAWLLLVGLARKVLAAPVQVIGAPVTAAESNQALEVRKAARSVLGHVCKNAPDRALREAVAPLVAEDGVVDPFSEMAAQASDLFAANGRPLKRAPADVTP